MSDFSKVLGEVVYRERKSQKLTQAQLAEMAGTTEQTIRKIERGDSNLQMSVLFPLIRALHIDPSEVFYPETAIDCGAKKQLNLLVSDCKEEEIGLILPIVKSAAEVIRAKETLSIKK